MILDPIKMALAKASGLSAVCASCSNYWTARDFGVPGDKCLSKQQCGSPLAGGDFHEYDGPFKGSLHLWCFVCGERSKYAVCARGRVQPVGVCREHLPLIQQLKPVGREVQTEIKSGDGRVPQPKAPKKSLISTMIEAEIEASERDRN